MFFLDTKNLTGGQNSKASVPVSCPKDTSLAAYKLWIAEIAKRLTTKKAEMKLTEEEWTENWKEYWKGRTNG